MSCNCKNARKIDKFTQLFPQLLDNKELNIFSKIVGAIVYVIKIILVVLAVIVITPVMTFYIVYQFIMYGSVNFKVPNFLKDN